MDWKAEAERLSTELATNRALLERIRRHEMIHDELRRLIEARDRCDRWKTPKPQARVALLNDIITLLSRPPWGPDA